MKKTLFSLSLFLVTGLAFGFDIPKLNSYVNDYAGIMSESSVKELEALLKDYQAKTGVQFFVLTVGSMQDAGSIEDYSIAVADKWKVGKKGQDDGLLLVVAMKEKRVRIEVGYGLEGKLPDVVASRIIRNEMAPRFKQGLFSDGVTATVVTTINTLGGYDTGNVVVADVKPQKRAPRFGSIIFLGIMLLTFLARGIFMPLYLAGGRGGRRSGGGGIFFGGFGGGGGFGDGGGFSGGGGGSFGGGGASGSW